MSTLPHCLTDIKPIKTSPHMTELWIVGCFAILLGLVIMILGGTGHSHVNIRYYGLGIFAQAWLIILLIGFLLIAVDFYISLSV